jgi:hypothetical protein
MNLKGTVVGFLLFVVVEMILLVKNAPPHPAGTVVGYDVLTMLHNSLSALTLITLIVFISVCSRFFQK